MFCQFVILLTYVISLQKIGINDDKILAVTIFWTPDLRQLDTLQFDKKIVRKTNFSPLALQGKLTALFLRSTVLKAN